MVQKNWQKALSRTKRAAFGRLSTLLGASELTSDFWEELEATFIQADLGVTMTQDLLKQLKLKAKQEGFTHGDQILNQLRSSLQTSLIIPSSSHSIDSLMVIVMIGVNGSGKTTTAARLAQYYKNQGKVCMLAAADTYRAAAAEQLMSWADSLGIQLVKGDPGSDPGAVVYNAVQAALTREADVLIIDTSGRMHTHHNLMAELQKVCRVPKKLIPDAPHEVLLVLDATTGQNGISQATAFLESVKVTGVILAKLDTSAKGGIGLTVASQLGLPILFVGTGESAQDLVEFDPEAYIDGLLSPVSNEDM